MAAAAQSNTTVIWAANPGPQTALIACPVFEVFFGGARGGGKTYGMLGDFIRHASLYGRHASGIMFRRQRTELIDTIEHSKAIYGPLGWTYHEQDKLWRAPDGARLRFAYLERDSDAEAYQGHSYTRVYVEEIGNFPSERPILKLMATLRSGAGVPVGFRATGNPGGPGHQWVKARYVDPAPMGFRVIKDALSGLERIFIPSKVIDNPKIGENYVPQLKMVGSENLVRAWLEGDWSVIDGAFFDCWGLQHVIRPFAIPDDWLRFRSCDWGSAAPFSVGWWAVAGENCRLARDGELQLSTRPDTGMGYDPALGVFIPRGALIRYREWYGARSPNVGLKLTAEEVGQGIAERERNEKITYGVLDPAAFAVDGGPSIAERMATRGVIFRRADNKRVTQKGALGGWDQMRARLKGEDDVPMIYTFSTCVDSIRTIPALQHDADKPEDLDTDGEDHAADEWRYACMSRPWITKAKAKEPSKILSVGPMNSVTLDDLWDSQPQRTARRI